MTSLPPLYGRPSNGLLVLQEEDASEEDEPENALCATDSNLQFERNLLPDQNEDWRFRTSSQTLYGALFVCLNIGVDPPDVERPAVCARMECWFEPDATATSKSLNTISSRLDNQYRKWHPAGRFKVIGDPTIVDLHKQCKSTRKNAKHDRVLFHYNGHGVPMPTETGEIWLFNSNYTKYIPLNLTDLQTLVGNPSLYVFDCNAAGRIVNYFRSTAADVPFLGEEHPDDRQQNGNAADRDCVLLAACGPNEKLPVDPKLPADLFTSCLTTPIRTALFCYASRSLVTGITAEMIDRIPGDMDDRNTPVGDLARIFTTVSDTIAWNVLPRDLFKRLFRQDLLLASMMRNFLLASRIMRFHGCTPESIPALPETHNHPLWDSFEYTMEQYLAQLPSNFRMQKAVQAEKEYREQFTSELGNQADQNINGIHKATLMREESRMAGYLSTYNWYRHPIQPGYSVTSGPLLTHNLSYEASSFFEDHIKAFEVWLDMGNNESFPPQQLPILLLLLIQPNYRQKGLQLLSRFLQIGRKAVEQALSIGVFPYILSYLKPGTSKLDNSKFLPELVLIWGKILAFDPKCKLDLAKISAHNHFVNFLAPAHDIDKTAPRSGVHLAVGLFIVSIFGTHPTYANECQDFGICEVCLLHISHPDPLVRRWACLCLSQILQNGSFGDVRELLHIAKVVENTALVDNMADVRAAAVSAIAEVLFHALRFLHSNANDLSQAQLSGTESPSGSYGRIVSGEYPGFDQTATMGANNVPRGNSYGDSTRLLENDIVDRVGRVIARMGLRNSSVLVRREVAIALSQAARLNPRPFVTAANEFPGINDRMLERIRSNAQLSPYSEMWLTLLELALDSHPVVASHARSGFDLIATHTFGSPASGRSASDSPTNTHDAFESPFIPVYGAAGTSVEDIRENRRSLRDTERDDLRSPGVPGIPSPTRSNGGHPDVLQPQTGRLRQSLPIRFRKEPVVHVRGSSGCFNLNSLAPQRRIPRVNSASVINLNDVSSLNNASSTLDLRQNRTDNDGMAASPKSHLGFALTHMVFGFWRQQSGGRSTPRPSANGNGSAMYPVDRIYSIDRVASPPRTQRRSRSYQVLPPENSVLDSLAVSYEQDDHDLLSRIRSNDFGGPNNADPNSGFPHRSQKPPVEKAVDSLFSWSCACMSRISVDSSGPDHMPEPDPVPQYTKLWDSILRQDSGQYLGTGGGLLRFNGESSSFPREGSDLLHGQIATVTERKTHYMGAGGGAVVSLAFLPREIGREGDEYIVTGDSTGSVGVYDTQSGECQSSFGIPAPPGVPDVEVTSVLCLNVSLRESSSLRTFMQHTPLILAGAYDGRVAVFRPDLVTKKYSVLSSFQASGRSLWSNFRRNKRSDEEKTRDKMANGGSARMNSAPQMKALLHSSGNGLVMDFKGFNSSLYAAGCEHNMLRVWDLSREMCTWEGVVMEKGVWPTSVSSPPWSSYHTVVVGGSKGSVTLVDTRTRSRAESLKVFGMHDDPIVSTAYGLWVGEGRGETIVSADCEGCIKLWDPRREGQVKRSEVKAHDTNLTAMAAHSSGNYIASGSTNKCVKLFRAKLGSAEMIRYRNGAASLPGVREQIAPVTGLAFQQDPCSLAVGCSDSTVSVYDLETRYERRGIS